MDCHGCVFVKLSSFSLFAIQRDKSKEVCENIRGASVVCSLHTQNKDNESARANKRASEIAPMEGDWIKERERDHNEVEKRASDKREEERRRRRRGPGRFETSRIKQKQPACRTSLRWREQCSRFARVREAHRREISGRANNTRVYEVHTLSAWHRETKETKEEGCVKGSCRARGRKKRDTHAQRGDTGGGARRHAM